MKKTFDIIYSIGTDCACAMYMKKCGMRKTSGPLDWITKPDFMTRINLICNYFEGFLEKENMRQLVVDRQGLNDVNNDSYEDINTGFKFYHDFKRDGNFDKSYLQVKEKYNRRIIRFYNLIDKSKRVLFIFYNQENITTNEQIILAYEKLYKKFGKKIYLLVIEHCENMSMNDIKYMAINEHIDKYELFTREYKEELKKNGGFTTLGLECRVKPIFNKYHLKYYILTKIKKFILKEIGRFIAVFVPIRSMRHKIRKDFCKF